MLELLGKLNARITELNDGSFVVDDQETPRADSLESADSPNAEMAHAPLRARAFLSFGRQISFLFSSFRRSFSLAPMATNALRNNGNRSQDS